ncbi:MAG: NAD(P)-binding domain-containing protein [Pseudomonadota bacterium]
MIGLGVMGRNLALNLRDRGFGVAVQDALPAALEPLAAQPGIRACADLAALIDALDRPRAILLMVPGRPPVE